MSGVTRRDVYERHVKEGNTIEEAFTKYKYVEQGTSSRRSALVEALADLVTQRDESSSFPFHVQRLKSTLGLFSRLPTDFG
jgi:hypothetical protein